LYTVCICKCSGMRGLTKWRGRSMDVIFCTFIIESRDAAAAAAQSVIRLEQWGLWA
jgi:hypothetical protein